MTNAIADEAVVVDDVRSPPSDFSWIDCSPSTLAERLLEDRFENDATATAVFLLECVSSLPDAESISARLMGGGGGGGVIGDDDDREDSTSSTTTEDASVVREDDREEEDDEATEKDGTPGDDPLGPPVLPFPEEGRPNTTTSAFSSTTVEVSCVQPRGKFSLEIRRRGLRFVHPKSKEALIVRDSDVRRIVIFPKPEDCRRASTTTAKNKKKVRPGRMALIILRDGGGESAEEEKGGVRWKGKKLRQVCFQLPPVPIRNDDDENDESSDDEDPEFARTEALFRSLRPPPPLDLEIVRVANPAHPSERERDDGVYAFRSDEGDAGTLTSTQGGMPFVKCHMGVNDGVLYPLKEGLLFYKPPTFVHRSDLRSVSCGRGNGGSRYVDLVLTMDGNDDEDETMEFANIDRSELKVLNGYVRDVLTKDAAKDSSDDDDTEENDDDGEDEGKRKRSRRAASRDARIATRKELLRSTADDDEEEEEEDEKYVDARGDDSSSEEEEEEANDWEGASDEDEEEEDFSPDDETVSDDDDEEEEEEEDDDDGRSRKKARK